MNVVRRVAQRLPMQLDITSRALITVTSEKHGHPASFLVDKNETTYWCSDGPPRHKITFTFSRFVNPARIEILTAYSIDESFTPYLIYLYAGTADRDRQLFGETSLLALNGWQAIKYEYDPKSLGFLQFDLEIIENYDYGKDSRVRGVRFMANHATPHYLF